MEQNDNKISNRTERNRTMPTRTDNNMQEVQIGFNMKNYMKRDKLFWVNPALFSDKDWPFKSRYAIGVRLADFRARNKKEFHFLIKDKMYSINRTDAFRYGLKYMIPHGTLPNLIPLDLFTATPSQETTARPKATEKPKTGGRQFQLSLTI